MPWMRIDTKWGEFYAEADDRGVLALRFPGFPLSGTNFALHPLLEELERELHQYLDGERTTFEIPVHLEGTTFQMAVWKALLAIPYGATASYSEIARRVGRPGAARAVGQAVGANPIPILVPCHRVLAQGGGLGGYGPGLTWKRRLLRVEGALLPP